MKRKLIVILTLISTTLFAQNKGTLTGFIGDKDFNNEPLPFANVIIQNTPYATVSNENGTYKIDLESGDYTIIFNFIGYESISEKISIKSNEIVTLNKSLGSGSISLQEVTVQNNSNREKESALLVNQKNALELKQLIGAQEISRKGIGDVATAVTKTSGISKQEGNNSIYVRGLGDRYNSTSINDLPVASNDPEKKNIALDIFTTDIVEYISIDKVYLSRLQGDFAGGNVTIYSKNFRGKNFLELSVGSSINSNAIQNRSNFYLQDGFNALGFNSYNLPNNALTSFNFQNNLNPIKENPIQGNFGLKFGNSFNIGKESKLNLFGTAGFSNNYWHQKGLNQSINAQGVKLKSFNQEQFGYKTNTYGMLNAAFEINENHNIAYTLLLTNSSNQTKETYFGFIRDLAENDNGLIQRGTYLQNTLLVNQLIGEHKKGNWKLDWGLSHNNVDGKMPDRTQNTMKFNEDLNSYTFGQNTITDNHRYFQKLNETEIAARVALSYDFKNLDTGDSKAKLTLGYQSQIKNRDFEAMQFNFRINGSQLNSIVNPNNLDAFLNHENYSNNYFNIESFSGMLPQIYTGEQNIHAIYTALEYKFSEKLSSIIGLRMEKIEQSIFWRTQMGSDKNSFSRNEFLPSLVLKYELNDEQNLRLAASKTYTLPQFKERALFIYEDVTERKFGNPYLYPSENYNLDLKWENFFKNNQLISIGVFGKYILNPINEVTVASSTNDISWVNIGNQGYVYGLEAEFRKTIFEMDNNNKLSMGLNAALMKTHQNIDQEKVQNETNGFMNINLTNKTSGFTGASNLLLNADLTYYKEFENNVNFSATILYSYYSDRLYALGEESKGNLIDKGMGTMDIIIKSKISEHINLSLTAKNILNPKFTRFQENANSNIPVLQYRRGAIIGLSLDYRF